jgi:predicted DNA-binding protein (UPF0251 family)
MPEGCPRIEAIVMTLEELEAVRLVDLLDLEQEEAAFFMGISRKAMWNDLNCARKKIASVLVYGMGLRIEGGSYILRGEEGSGEINEDEARDRNIALMERELSLLQARLECLSTRITALKSEEKVEKTADSET